MHLGVFDGLDGSSAFVAVDPEGLDGVEGVVAAFFEMEEVGLGVADKEHSGYERPGAGGAVGCACLLYREIYV